MTVNKFHSLSRLLKDRIRSGAYAKQGRLPGEKELLRELGVSKVTLRKALDLLAEEGLVHPVPGKGTFLSEANAAPWLERPRETPRLGILMPQRLSRYGASILDSMIEFSQALGLDLVQPGLAAGGEGQRGRLELILAAGVQGVVLFNEGAGSVPLCGLCLKEMKPLVLLDNPSKMAGLDVVSSDNRGAGALLAGYFTRLGHRRLVYVNDNTADRPSTRERLEGFSWGIASVAGCACEFVTIDRAAQRKRQPEVELQEYATLLVLEFVKKAWRRDPGDRPTAFIGQNEEALVACMQALQRHGVAVPHQVSVGGFDGLPPGFTGLTATACEQDGASIGRRALELLLRRIRVRQAAPLHCQVPMRLILGGTDRSVV